MHIQIQCCGIVLMMVLFYFYMRQKRVSLDTQRAFLGVFFATFICIMFDVLSIGAIEYRHVLSEPFAKFMAKSYLVTLLGVAVSALSYMCVDIYAKQEVYRKKMSGFWILGAAGVIATYAAPLHYRYAEDEEKVLYTYGPGVLVTYGTALVFFITIFYLLKKERAKINPRRREAVCIWLFIWIIASQIQYMYTDVLIVGYAGSIGIMVLYLKLENPETNLDRSTGLFNSGALYQFISQFFAREEEFAALVIIFEKHAAEKRSAEIRQRFQAGWGEDHTNVVRPFWLYLPHSGVTDRAENFLYLIRYVRQNEKELSEHVFFTIEKDSVEKMYREKETEQMILDAMEEDRVEVFYQPIFSTEKHRITSAEALVRIRDQEGNIVPPGMFIDIAEENGMILRLGSIVFEKVCCFIREHPPEQYGLDYIEVNLSVVQCGYEHLAEEYIRIMEKYGTSSRCINLEITESASTSAKKTLLGNMEKLMEYGIKFSLDDFGTGQSNLNYIVEMPVDIVKFDRSMTNAYFENRKARYVMDAAIQMIQGMNLEIVSEGIETEEQYQTMEELGISHIQGYYFSKPLPENEFLRFLESRMDGQEVQ